VAAEAVTEGVSGREPLIAALVRAALASDIVGRAAARAHWREVYVGCPLGDGVLEGFVDLLYRDDDGLVVIDYKTDSWRNERNLDTKVDRYRVQLAAYAYAVSSVVGEAVARAVLLFLGPAGAVEREVDVATVDIPSLAAQLR
jgi:ATP-dependent helicase/nuclease subunit A